MRLYEFVEFGVFRPSEIENEDYLVMLKSMQQGVLWVSG